MSKRGATIYFWVLEGGSEIFFTPSAQFPNFSLSKIFSHLRRNLLYTCTLIVYQYVLCHIFSYQKIFCPRGEVRNFFLRLWHNFLIFPYQTIFHTFGAIYYTHAPSLFTNMFCATFCLVKNYSLISRMS